MTSALGRQLRLSLGAPDGARGIPTPPVGWPELDGRVTSLVRGPFLGLEGPGFEKTWYDVELETALPADFDPFYTLHERSPGQPVTRVLLRPDLADPLPPTEIRALPDDVIGMMLGTRTRARVSVYVGLAPGADLGRLTLAALKDGPLRWVCAAWVASPTSPTNSS
jgi:hypothetical protein